MPLPTYQSSLYQLKSQRVLREKAIESLRKHHLTGTEWTIVGQLYEHKNGVTLSELAEIIGVDAPLITILIDQLVNKKLVEKHSHPKDKRAKLLFLTKKARELVPVLETDLQNKLRLLFEGATNFEVETYLKILILIVENGEKE